MRRNPGHHKETDRAEEPKAVRTELSQGEYRIEKQLEDMDKAGVKKAVLKIPCCHHLAFP